MSTGQWIGAVLGFIVGLIIPGGGLLWGIYGAVIGYTIGGYIDPVKPDIKQPGAPAPQGLQVMTNIIGNPIFDALGTAKITGQLLFFGGEFNVPIWYRPSKGVRAISGYKYYASWALGISMGQIDCLYTIFRDQDPIWEGELLRPESGGEATIQIEGMGAVYFYFGTDDQMPNSKTAELIPDPTLNTGHRHLCWAFFDAFFMNEYNRMPSMSFIVRKTPPLFSAASSRIQIYDTNPIHAIWYMLAEKAGLPAEWLHTADFSDSAAKIMSESRGISILFDIHQATLNYLEAINSHVDTILRYGSDGKFHPKLLRYDYVPAELPVVDESFLIEEPTFSRRSWIDTINEVKVQYSEIVADLQIIATEIGLIPYGLRQEGDLFYVVGYRVVDSSYRLCVGIYSTQGRGYVAFEDYEESVSFQTYYGIDVYGDYLYVTGQIEYGGVKAICRKIDKLTLETVWTQIWSDAAENSSYSTTALVEGGYVYTGSYIGGVGGSALKLNDLDGTVVWSKLPILGQELFGEIFDADPSVDFCGTAGGQRLISRRNKSDGIETVKLLSEYLWWYKGFSKENFYYLAGRHDVLGDNKSCVSKISPVTTVSWDADMDFVSGQLELFNNCCTDESDIFAIGIFYDITISAYRATFAKLSFEGVYEWDFAHLENRRSRFGICADLSFVYIGTWKNVAPVSGFLEVRSKEDGSLVEEYPL